MSRPDAVVIGAGPAGCAAALTLARGGASVVVLERARFPRDKCCGDGLTAGALRQLEALGLAPSSVPSWRSVADVALRSPSGRTLELRLPSDGQHTAIAARHELDAALADLVRATPGVILCEGDGLAGVSIRSDGLTVTTTGGSRHEAPFLVGADGAWSPTRRALDGGPETRGPAGPVSPSAGLGRPRSGYLGDWHAMRQYFTGASPAAERLWVWFDPDLLPAYAWSFPLGDARVNVGYGLIRRPGVRTGTMGGLWQSILRRPHVRAVLGDRIVPEGTVKAWPIPAAADPHLLSAAHGRVLFAGDAARVGDPMTGEGIGQALESGAAAAHCILGAGPSRPQEAAASYTSTVRRTLHLDSRLAGRLSRVLAHPVGARGAVAMAGLSGWTRSNFTRWMFEDYPRAVLATPYRWEQHVFSPPGAYR